MGRDGDHVLGRIGSVLLAFVSSSLPFPTESSIDFERSRPPAPAQAADVRPAPDSLNRDSSSDRLWVADIT